MKYKAIILKKEWSSNGRGYKYLFECNICHITKYLPFHRIENGEGLFCSQKCYQKTLSLRMRGNTYGKANKGKIASEETKRKIRENHADISGKNNPNWKGGKPKCLDCNIILSRWNVKRCSKCWYKFARGKYAVNWQNKTTEINCDNCGKIFIKSQYQSNKYNFCTYKCKYKWQSKNFIGYKNPNWRGGTSFEPYGSEFNKKLKEQIRQRDNHTCQKCFKTQEQELQEYNRKLNIHHIDYNKKNCNINNLITLCLKCNSLVNGKRIMWKNFFMDLIKQKYEARGLMYGDC